MSKAKSNVQIQTFNQEDPGFWALMGRYFADPAIAKEMGVAMVSEPNHTWVVAILNDQVLGFAAVVPSKIGAQIRRDYVLQEFRDAHPKLHQQLIEHAVQVEDAKGRRILGTANPSQVAAYEAAGFKKDIQVGRYWKMLKEEG